MKKKIIICDCDHKDVDNEIEICGREGYEVEWLQCETQEEVIEKCQDSEVLLNQYVLMDKKVFASMPNLKCIVRYGVGYDNINLQDATEYGIQVCNVPDYGTREVADQALAHMMAHVRKLTLSNKLVREGIWDYQYNIPVYRLSECIVGIVGVGRIGSEFAKRVYALGCKIIAYDIASTQKERKFPDFVEFVSFEELLEQADVISVHSPKDERTYHMFGKKEFEKMKDSAFIINVSRGGIIDEEALVYALENKLIAGAGLDVVENEPLLADHPLLQFDTFTISPHSAWYSEQAAQEMNRKVAEEAMRFVKGEQLHYPLNKVN